VLVSLASAIRNHPAHRRPLVAIYQDFIEHAVLAEQLGFHRIWASEHHLAEDDWNPSPITVLAAVAARTSTVRLGTFVLLLPLHHPLKIAEDVATLDILSNGRFDLGVGAGPMEVECEAFGIKRSEAYARTYEALAVIERLFTEECVTHEGKYYKFHDVAMTTKPVQKPMPPVYTTPLFGPQSWEKSAQRGYNVASALHSPMWTDYPALLAKYGRRREDVRIASGPLFVHVAASRDQAYDEAEASLHWAVDFYLRRGMPMPLAPLGEFRKPENAVAYGCPIAAGSPDDVLKILSAYRDAPMDELSVQFNHPGLDPRLVERSIRLFAKEVLPEIRRWRV
jgi:alkanesulfonate monooxygenase SsuD/methylene tetrahydromethanopterin reductase-like flavin-dependent oxidoreductase (luciferase family)